MKSASVEALAVNRSARRPAQIVDLAPGWPLAIERLSPDADPLIRG